MLHNLKHKNSKTMGKEAVRWQIMTIAFLSVLIGVFCFAGVAEADNYTITFNDVTVNENAGTADFLVSLTPPIQGIDTLRISFVTADVLATKGSDFHDPVPLYIDITSGNHGTISIPIDQDGLYEEDETFTVTITPSYLAGTGTISYNTDNVAVGTIQDDGDTYNASLEASKIVSEGAGTVTFTVALDQQVPGGASVDFSLGGGDATSGLDYSENTLNPLTFLANETTKDITINILDDDIYELDETFNVSLTAGGNQTVTGSPSTCTITDNGDTYNVSLEASKSVSEDAGTVTFTVALDQQVPGGASVAFSLGGGDATSGSDYSENTASPLTFLATETTKNITINILNDSLYELDETFNITLTAGANQTVTGSPAICTITDDDTYNASLEASKTVSEGIGTVTFTVTLDQQVPGGASVAFSLGGGDATLGSDYSENTASPLTFLATETTKDITINILDDDIYEFDETFNVSLTAGGNQTVSGSPATCTITDNGDTYNVSLEASKSVSEDAGTVTFTVALDQQVPGGASVAFSLGGGDATLGSDYSENTASPLTFLATETTKDITINILNDLLIEPDETFNITITAGANQTVSGSPATCTINDNDYTITPSVTGANGTISPNTPQIVEHGNSQTFTFIPDAGFVVDVITIDGSTDYMTGANEYTFTNVTSNHTIDVTFRAPYTVQVNINPVAAQGEGRWRLINNTGGYDFGQPITGWQTHGTTVDVPGNIPNVTIEFFDVTCWAPPGSHNVDLAANNNYVYDAPPYTLRNFTLTLAKTGNGMVTSDDGHIVAPGSHLYTCGPDVAITADPDESWVFDHWEGNVAEPLLPKTTVSVSANETVTAVFVGNTFTLHMAKSGEGTVTPSVGTHAYNENEIVNLSANPATDWAFDHWTGGVANSAAANTTITMDEDQTVTAFFITTVNPGVDADGDTYSPNGGDCNDNDPTIHPHATEICGDGIDQDCDGFDISCDVDNDGDGYLSSIDPADPSYDCDDNDSSIHPGATEICGDTIDQDCDGSDLACTGDDLDKDGDGYTVNMGDCMDVSGGLENGVQHEEIHPGAAEICGDGVDNDCYDGDRGCQAAEVKCVDISDTPLDTQVSAAPANIMFVLDDSGSMDWEFTTPSGVYRGYYYPFDEAGNDNNYGDQYILPPDERRRWESQWPGHNKMSYDPASTYMPWPNHSGIDNLPDADPDTPRSNPVSASPTFDFNAEPYLSLYENNCVKVTVTRESDGGSTCADAVRFRRVSDGTMFIIDNSGVGFETSGNWSRSSGEDGYEPFTPGFNGGWGFSLYSSSNGSVAAWKPSLLTDGSYEVYASWTQSGTRASNAPYRIYNGDGSLLGTVTVDQNANMGQWNSLGTFNFTNVTPVTTRDIHRAHYYRWHDADADNNVDDGEIYLIELDGAPPIKYYRFDDNVDNNNRLDYGELTDVTGSQPPEIEPKTNDDPPVNRTYAQERQNFANWYSFYRKREYTAKAAVGSVIDDMDGVNIGIKCINNDVVEAVRPVKVDSGGTMLDDSDYLLGRLYTINSSGGTPLRRGLEAVGRYFDADDGETGGIGATPYVSSASGECQQSFAIVMTDGYYNGGDPLGTIGNADNDGLPDPGPQGYPFDGGVYGDSVSNTLADVAMHYYERDLSSSLNDLVPVGGGDTARHQHMVTYTIAFGVLGTIIPTDWPNCPNTCPAWPTLTPPDTDPSDDFSNQDKIDDMYHAAVNGRGKYLSAENPQALIDALKALQEAIEEKIGSGASVSINSQQLSTTSLLFQGRYNTNTWSGDIRAFELDPDTGELPANYKWSTHDRLELVDWDTGREIITYDGTDGMKFRPAEINTAGMLSLLDADSAKASAIVDFIRGDDSNEQDQGGTYSFRARGSKLGDIVHSSPILAGNVLYVGSNSGMLHAFDVGDGDEIFAYVPRLVFETLNKLTVENPNYAHTYYIDQSPYIANVGGSSLLVNTLGKGGKGVYCLNITDITNAELNPDTIFNWEYPDSTNPDVSPDLDMGYGFSRAFIVDSKAGPVVIFGNGYDSANERAVLYVLDPKKIPTVNRVMKKIDTFAGSPGPGDCNGLSTPILIDIDMDLKVDFAYAGDLLGNMWKFDLRDSDVNNWHVAYDDGSPQPLFQAKNALGHRQPITMKPDVMRHCTANRAGYMVLFGTGRYMGNADFADNSVQTLYGIWDWQDAWENEGLSYLDKHLGSLNMGTPRKLSNLDGNGSMPTNAQNVTLLEQTQVFFGSEFGEQFRVISDNKPVWYLPGSDADFDDDGFGNPIISHAGWYFDLPANSERAFKDVLIYPSVSGNVNIAISSIPSDSPCSAGGDSILHAMDACSGARLDKPFWNANNDDSIDSDDLINIGSAQNPIWVVPTGWFKEGMYYPPAILSLEDGTSMLYFGTSDATVDPTRAAGQPLGLTNWREIE